VALRLKFFAKPFWNIYCFVKKYPGGKETVLFSFDSAKDDAFRSGSTSENRITSNSRQNFQFLLIQKQFSMFFHQRHILSLCSLLRIQLPPEFHNLNETRWFWEFPCRCLLLRLGMLAILKIRTGEKHFIILLVQLCEDRYCRFSEFHLMTTLMWKSLMYDSDE